MATVRTGNGSRRCPTSPIEISPPDWLIAFDAPPGHLYLAIPNGECRTMAAVRKGEKTSQIPWRCPTSPIETSRVDSLVAFVARTSLTGHEQPIIESGECRTTVAGYHVAVVIRLPYNRLWLRENPLPIEGI
jgi:hypothetical protein